MIDPLNRCKASFCLGEEPHGKLKQASKLEEKEKQRGKKVND